MKFLAFSLLAAIAWGQKPIPPIDESDSEYENHEGQPKWCSGRDEKGYAKNCGICERRCGQEHNASNCKTYCRARACKCHPECVPTGRTSKPLSPRQKAEIIAKLKASNIVQEWASLIFFSHWQAADGTSSATK